MRAEITGIIDVLKSADFYGAGESVEIAKGKYEYVSSWVDFKRKVRRVWQSKKQ
jgi:hypothetical protein